MKIYQPGRLVIDHCFTITVYVSHLGIYESGNLVSIGSDNGLSRVERPAITETNT